MVRFGQKLHDERVRKGLTLEDVAKATKIRLSFLSALEKGEYKKLPSSAYAEGFVKNYSEFLGFSSKEMLALFRREFDEKKVYSVMPEQFAKTDDFSGKKMPLQQTGIVGLLFFLGLLLYIFFQYKYAIFSPPLTISSPKENQVFATSAVQIIGQTDANAAVIVGNEATTVDENGHFKKTLSLFPGKQQIIVKAVSRFGRENVVTRTVTVRSE